MVIEIRDQQFIATLYRDFCRRGVHGKNNRDALAQKRIEIYWRPAFGQRLEINIFTDDILAESAIDLGWSPVRGASVNWCGGFNAALGRCDRTALTKLVRRLLLKHGVIDERGYLVKRGAA